MKSILAYAAPLLLVPSFLLAQQPGPQGYPPPPQGYGRADMERQSFDQEQERADHDQERAEREQMYDERQDLNEIGLPQGAFWLNPELASRVRITPDQMHRLADAYLQGRLKIIQLEANEEMEEAKLDAMESAPSMDNAEALGATDRIADARAAIDKADAHLAFALRAILSPEQLTLLRNGFLHDGPNAAHRQTRRPAGGPQTPTQRQTPPA